jgi:hypothetical protein
MSEKEDEFYKAMKEDYKNFTDSLDKRFTRVITTLVGILTLIILPSVTIFFTYSSKYAETRADVTILKHDVDIILKNAVTQKAINDIITTYDNTTKAMETFLPDDIKGFVEATDEQNRKFRTYIMMFQSGINTRGEKVPESKNGGDK